MKVANKTPGMKLLIVDDSLFIRDRIERAVALPEVSTMVTAANGRQALDVFDFHKPELVTLDITMPELDGVATTEQLLKRNPKVCVLIVSALADKKTAIEALKRGARGFLLKPFTDHQLNDALLKLIKHAQGK
jgi:two-component system, chemotaxis family, chemotaxis protein CheY